MQENNNPLKKKLKSKFLLRNAYCLSKNRIKRTIHDFDTIKKNSTEERND